MQNCWLHAPFHSFQEEGTYMVTGATAGKFHFFKEENELDILHEELLSLAEKYGWVTRSLGCFF